MNVYIVNLILAVVWSGYYVTTKYAVSDMSLMAVGMMAHCVSFIVWIAYLANKGVLGQIPGFIQRFPAIIVVAAISFGLNITFLVGLHYSSAINASILSRFDIVFTLILGYFFFRYNLSWKEYIGIGVMGLSLLVLIYEDLQTVTVNLAGDINFLLSALGLAVNAFLIRHKLRSVPNSVIAACNIFMVILGFLFFGLVLSQLDSIPLMFYRLDLFVTICLAGLSSALVFLLYYFCLERLEVWIVRTILMATPGITIILAYIFLNETIGTAQVLGLACMLCGYLFIIKSSRAQRVS